MTMNDVEAVNLWRDEIKKFYTGGTVAQLLDEGSQREIRETVLATILRAYELGRRNPPAVAAIHGN